MSASLFRVLTLSALTGVLVWPGRAEPLTAEPAPAAAKATEHEAEANPGFLIRPAMQWQPTVEATNALASQSGRLMLVNFYATWCPYSRQLDAENFNDPLVQVLMGEFVCVRLNLEQGRGPALANFYAVKSPPTVLFVKTSGEVVQTRQYASISDYRVMLAGLLREHSSTRLERELRDRSTRLGAAISLSAIHGALGDPVECERMLKIANEQRDSPQAQECTPRLWRLNLIVAGSKSEDGHFDWAMPFLERAIELSQTPVERGTAQLLLATCHLELRDKQSARPLIRQVLDDPTMPRHEREWATRLFDAAR